MHKADKSAFNKTGKAKHFRYELSGEKFAKLSLENAQKRITSMRKCTTPYRRFIYYYLFYRYAVCEFSFGNFATSFCCK